MSGLVGKGVPASQPAWLLYVKAAIIGLSVIILALSAYSIATCGNIYGGLVSYVCAGSIGGFEIFLVIKTWILYGLILFVELKAQHMFYRLAVIIACAISIIFWLSGWAWAASWASTWNAFGYYGVSNKIGGAMAGVAALGAVVWILCIVHLVFFVLACMRDPAETAAPTGVANAELGQVQQKPGEYPVQQAYPVQPAPYQGQPVPQQAYPVQQQPQQYVQQPYAQQQPYATQ